MISEEHWKNDEISFQNAYGHRGPVKLRIRGILIENCVCYSLFFLGGGGVPLHEERKRDVIVSEKI